MGKNDSRGSQVAGNKSGIDEDGDKFTKDRKSSISHMDDVDDDEDDGENGKENDNHNDVKDQDGDVNMKDSRLHGIANNNEDNKTKNKTNGGTTTATIATRSGD